MSENPLQALFQTFAKLSNTVQAHLSNLIPQPPHHSTSPITKTPSISISSSSKVTPSPNDSSHDPINKGQSAGPVTKEGLGRATWTFLHTLAAQMSILSRMYPCKECADHFQEILRSNPVQAGSHAEFSQWLCHVHNTVNRSLNKVVFPCERVEARWGKLECEQRACDILGSTTNFWK
ncbi:FAD-linked sulfhydryl oxidase ERV1 isoform X2 [Argentina anserina]|uniref:FAD-linked sulfhydryl oxidase ERV1 isoform X2 n=1 Tax=Argentina anserina TaxID=57926 RepID=UPI0021766AD6|nr:FAD-linked sulfhydryl oxidase ERV1 isoform X2 [Potentilla anserina]